MIKLPKNCKLSYLHSCVRLTMTFPTKLSVGNYKNYIVFKSNKNNTNYKQYTIDMKYQEGIPRIVFDKYFEIKKKSMLENRILKKEILQKEIDILKEFDYPCSWHLFVDPNIVHKDI